MDKHFLLAEVGGPTKSKFEKPCYPAFLSNYEILNKSWQSEDCPTAPYLSALSAMCSCIALLPPSMAAKADLVSLSIR